jgi:formylmethanofuran--tetrahydromethanopterin N-formyltransferase
MIINGVEIEDTFAEAFDMRATRIIITAINFKWARHAALTMTGFATSVIGCGVEAGIERVLHSDETPDGRPGVAVLLFAISTKVLAQQLEARVGQCVLTCPTTAVFAGIEGEEHIPLGQKIRYFGDGFQTSKMIGDKRFWRVPVMDGEFLCEETTARVPAVGGGNFLVLAKTMSQALLASEAAIDAIYRLSHVIMPFPGGGVRSGSKVGSKYARLIASTNDPYCPTLKGMAGSRLTADIGAAMEIVIDGLGAGPVRHAMRTGVQAVCALGTAEGIVRISASNSGGKLGAHQFHLREILSESAGP